MSKFHKRNKSKKRIRRKTKPVEDAKNKIGEVILNSKDIEEDIEVLAPLWRNFNTRWNVSAFLQKQRDAF